MWWFPHSCRVPGVVAILSCWRGDSGVTRGVQGSVFTWGANGHSQLGLSREAGAYCERPHKVETLAEHPVQSVACGSNHTLFLTSRGVPFNAHLSGDTPTPCTLSKLQIWFTIGFRRSALGVWLKHEQSVRARQPGEPVSCPQDARWSLECQQ